MAPDTDPVRQQVDAFDQAQLAAAHEPLEPVLDAQRMRIEYAETRRAALGVLGGVVLGAGLAGLIQLAGADVSYRPGLAGLVTLTACLTATGVAVLVLYGRQTTWPYPFKEDLAATWKWFYRDAIPEARDVVPQWHSLQPEGFRRRSQKAFVDSRAPYAERMLTLADRQINLTQDLEQAHLLNWNEFYKNSFLDHLRMALIRGVILSIGAGLVAFLLTIAIRAL